VNLLREALNELAAEIMLSPNGFGLNGVREFQWHQVA
jgi:hypothetical protein